MQSSGDLISRRLRSHHLVGGAFATLEACVSHFGAIQAQDYAAAKWALALRTHNQTDAALETALDEGRMLRTHIMRPTWHLVSPEDIRWLQDLTAPRVHAQNASMYKKLGLDAALLRRCHDVITRALQGKNYRTRAELAAALEQNDIPARGQRLAYIVMHAELAALVCSGPRRGKQFTYGLVGERAPGAQLLERDAALARLALTYFTSHGPAQLRDFSWWSGLSAKDAGWALELAKPSLHGESFAGKSYWFSPMQQFTASALEQAFLLSIYDEYTIAYKDRSDLSEARDLERMLTMGNALTSVVILGGKVAGVWKRAVSRSKVNITLDLFRTATLAEKAALATAGNRYGAFLGLPVALHL